MTERKPARVSFESWVERQIRTAQESGAFADLPGAGKPIPGLGRRYDELDRVAEIARREQLDTSAFLPPSLALPRELEDLADLLDAERTEGAVRAHLEDLNRRIRAAHRRPQEGPPLRAVPVDVEAQVAGWRARRDARSSTVDTPAPAAEVSPARARRRWSPSRRRRGG